MMKTKNATPGLLGVGACTMLLIGAMVGSAIFSLSGVTILEAGPAAVISWLAAGLIMLAYGMCMAELACRYPESGGVYYFPMLAFGGQWGRWLGWLSCWSCILTNIVAVAFSGIYVGIYLSVAFPWAEGMHLPLALGSILFCLILNLFRVDIAGKLNAILVVALVGLMGVYITFAWGSPAYDYHALTPFFTQGTGGKFGAVNAIATAVIGYSGIVALAFMAGDVKNAGRTIPLAMLISMILVGLLYSMMILATTGLITADFLDKNPGMRFIPMFAACFTKLTDLPWLPAAVSLGAVLALMTTMGVCISINARALKAAGDNGMLPEFFGRESKQGIPAIAAIVTGLVSMIYCFFPEYTQSIVNFGAVFNILTMALTLLALIRARMCDKASVFTVPGGKCVPYLVLAILLFINVVGIFTQGIQLWLYTALFIAIGVVIGRFGRKTPTKR